MKLWLKQTLICLLVILTTFGACLYLFVAQETSRLLDDAVQQGLQQLTAFEGHLSTLERTSGAASSEDETTRRALIQFTFSTYAHLLQSKDVCYSLVIDGQYLYNISPHDAQLMLPSAGSELSAHCMLETADGPMLLAMQNTELLGMPITVYIIRSIAETFANIAALTRTAQLAMLTCLVISGILLPLTLRRTLRPLRKLTRVSEEISGGQYTLRSRIHTPDEVGDLSRSFDHMAETVAQKILALEDTANRRELLLGALTHEMKTPMTAIIGFSDSLLTMPLTEEGRMEAAHEVHESALRTERLSQKMMQLIAMMDCPVLVRRTLDARELLEQAAHLMAETAAAKDITLRTRADVPTLSGDSDLLLSLLTNLIDNAVKASPAGSSITIAANADGLSVTDEGCGIPADKIRLVTEPFYRVDKARSRKHGGAGLGLSLCRMIAEAHGGQLVITSREREGTTIALRWTQEEQDE